MTETPPLQPANPAETAKAAIADLAKNRAVNRDQERVATLAIEDPGFALLANRALNQGADPELLRRTMPEAFTSVAAKLGLSEEDAVKTIEQAHAMGPGSLPMDSSKEWLWLILAKHSADEAKAPAKPEQVMADTARRLVRFEAYAEGNPDVEADARAFRTDMLAKIAPVGMAPQGADVPLYEHDLGFYAAYRNGKHVAAMKDANGLVFYGTDGSVTLEQSGIAVDKPLSPFFGIVFPPKQES
ncbi:hypothetical protein L0Y59_00705 [Candidatus Uhrbacteria bacterium]|nr:hypothetical protein [Candidatus Uhrbacteria bacterium]